MDNETSIRLIELYGSLKTLWDPQEKGYYNKIKREHLWDEIAKNFDLSKKELKAKMKSLLSAYRRERNREKNSNVTRSGRNKSYKSKWYAYQSFYFLDDKNNPVETFDTMDSSSSLDTDSNNAITNEIVNTNRNANNVSETNTSLRGYKKKLKNKAVKRSYDNSVTDAKDQILEDAIELIRKQTDNSNDPYIAFGMHIAAELKKYDARTLTKVKHSINTVIFEADMACINEQTSGYHDEMDDEKRPEYFTSSLTDVSHSSNTNIRSKLT
ncbi:uncharacterized protein [Onthophagus taurus]|uniref:uncharacterized protein n=1 Tax=Onthophagus taurus TaxID=166361 RepID=UPI0039BEAFCE